MSDSSTAAWPAPFEPESETSEPVELRIVEIVPRARLSTPRVVGPGKRERAYLERVAALEDDLRESAASRTELEQRARKIAAELEMVSLLERGSERRLNRTERDLARSEEERRASEQREKRLILAMGALQNENQRLARELARLGTARPLALGGGTARGWRARLVRWLGG